jgi:hypothetical protein
MKTVPGNPLLVIREGGRRYGETLQHYLMRQRREKRCAERTHEPKRR